MSPLNCLITRLWKAGCIIRRWRAQKSPSLTIRPLPSSIFTRSRPTPFL